MSRFRRGDIVVGVNEQVLVRLAEVLSTFNNGEYIKVKLLEYEGISEFNGETANFESSHFIKSTGEREPITLIDGTQVEYDYRLHTYLSSGKYSLKTEVVVVEGKNVHPMEFETLGIVLDQWPKYHSNQEVYRFKSNLKTVWISLTEKGFSSNIGVSCSDTSEKYISEEVATLHGRGYSEMDRSWRLLANCKEAEPCRENCVEGYHSHTKVNDKSDNSVYTIGYEVEKEDLNAMLSLKAKVSRLEHGWRKESDSSLDSRIGFEFISPVYDLFDANGKRKADFENPIISKHLHAKYSASCGGHINLGEKGKKTEELFEELSGYLPLLYAIYESRIKSTYSSAVKKDKYFKSKDKHRAIFIKANILEFRIFPAVKNVVQLEWRTRLIQLMVMNKTNNPMDVVVMMANKKSDLYNHLRILYTAEEILGKIKAVFKYMKEYNDVTPDPTEETLYNPTTGFEVTDPSEADYHAKSIIDFDRVHNEPKIKDSLRVVPKQVSTVGLVEDLVLVGSPEPSGWFSSDDEDEEEEEEQDEDDNF